LVNKISLYYDARSKKRQIQVNINITDRYRLTDVTIEKAAVQPHNLAVPDSNSAREITLSWRPQYSKMHRRLRTTRLHGVITTKNMVY